MKKVLSIMLCLAMVLSFAACGEKKAAEWTRVGSFSDGESAYVNIQKSEDSEHPGWLVSVMAEEGMHGWYIQQEGNELKGNLKADYETDGEDFIVTIAEEGEDGIKLTIDGGKSYSLKPYEIPQAKYAITINTRGEGTIAYAQEGEELVFDEDFPATSAYIGVEDVEKITIAAKPAEGYKFWKWTKNGEDFSADTEVTFDITESAEYIAHFGPKGIDETHVDLESVKTLGQIMGLPEYGSSTSDGKYIYAFEQDWVIYRAIANLDEATYKAVFDIEFDDPEYDTKVRALLKDVAVDKIENISEKELKKDQLAALAGKTGKELTDAGWTVWGFNTTDNQYQMEYDCFSYEVIMEGQAPASDDPDASTIADLTVKSIVCTGLGSVTNLE